MINCIQMSTIITYGVHKWPLCSKLATLGCMLGTGVLVSGGGVSVVLPEHDHEMITLYFEVLR